MDTNNKWGNIPLDFPFPVTSLFISWMCFAVIPVEKNIDKALQSCCMKEEISKDVMKNREKYGYL